MNESKVSGQQAPAGRDEHMSALFGQLVMQQANMAMMLLGKVAHPETGQTIKDLEAAKLFIDQLEMLEAKTKGNLSKEESGLLKQSLMNLRLSFVEAVEAPPTPGGAERQAAGAPPEGRGEKEPEKSGLSQGPASAGEESHKKFTKKY
jgi:hypothetical protein